MKGFFGATAAAVCGFEDMCTCGFFVKEVSLRREIENGGKLTEGETRFLVFIRMLTSCLNQVL
jgi:hypothetical protein